MMNFGGMAKRVGGAIRAGVDSFEKSTGPSSESDSQDGKNMGSTGKRVGTAVRSGINKLRGRNPRPKSGPKQPISLKGVF